MAYITSDWNEPPGPYKRVEVEFVRPFDSLLRAKAVWGGCFKRSSNLLRGRRRLILLIYGGFGPAGDEISTNPG